MRLSSASESLRSDLPLDLLSTARAMAFAVARSYSLWQCTMMS